MTPEPKYLANLVIDEGVSDPIWMMADGGRDVLEYAIRDDLPLLRPEREARPKRRGDKDDEDGGDAEIEEGVLVLNAAALVLVAHFATSLVGLKSWEEVRGSGIKRKGGRAGENPRSTRSCYDADVHKGTNQNA